MFSYEQRLKTFTNKKWPTVGYKSTPHTLAICGYICKSTTTDLAAMCVYCKKHLEGWEKTDIPIIEHYSHKKDCVLFSPSKLVDTKIPNFIRYDLKENVPFIFCYKCGSTDTSHICPVTKRYKLDLKKSSDFFFIRLLSGEYKDIIDLYMSKGLYLPIDIKRLFQNVTNEGKFDYNPLKTVKEFISDFVDKEIKDIKEKFEKDIEEYLK